MTEIYTIIILIGIGTAAFGLLWWLYVMEMEYFRNKAAKLKAASEAAEKVIKALEDHIKKLGLK